ncbi:MAG: HAD family phosphatase [Planctomycetes bacterium]|nr:HAD family phosphatase [Planctomycetota bacterium]MBU1518573.1 HAD family phosphatase [Planctomycetota bacterium]MBU2458466.1 HAD family phosphatase [Planctomycetota bacterium]
MVKAVIFDFDGVISDSEPCHFAATNEVLKGFGFQLSKEEYYAEYLGFTDYELFEAVKDRHKADYKGISIDQLVEKKAVAFEKLIKQIDHLIDGVSELIGQLKNNKVNVAINSGASLADIKIMLTGSAIENSFDVIVSADDVSQGKPHPEGYLMALEELNAVSGSLILAGQCAVVEDSQWGIISAKRAGMKVIAVTNSYSTDELNDADLVVDSVKQLKIGDLQRLCSA